MPATKAQKRKITQRYNMLIYCFFCDILSLGVLVANIDSYLFGL